MDSFDIFKKLSVGAKFKRPEKSVPKLEVTYFKINVFDKIYAWTFLIHYFCFIIIFFSFIKNDKSSTRQIKIKTVGDRVPEALSTFDSMKMTYSLSSVLLENIKKSGYIVPTPIQTQAIPIMLQVSK